MENQFQDIFDRLKNRKNEVASRNRHQRAAKLKRLLSYIMDHRMDIHEVVWQDFRKPPAEVDLSEIFVVTSEIRHVIDNLGIWMHRQRVKNPVPFSGSRSYIRYEPRGVCLIISPWNFPFNLAMGPLVSAIAAGNCVVLKPSEFSPNTSRFVAKLVHDCFDHDEVAVVEGDKETAQSLLELPFDHVFFTGSPSVGKKVMEAASHHLTSVTLELGGKSPVIIDGTANLADAAQKICWGKFINAGQTCVAPDYVLIQEEKEMEFLSLLGREIENRYGKSPEQRLKNPDFARLIDDRHTRRLIHLLEESQKQGAEVFFGGHYDSESQYMEPTVLRNITDDLPVMREEIFGPLLPVIRYNKLDEAIACIDK
ncbi:MAG TPA: aldehyde dehydrogenase family protein, partial [Balneolales bacterium]|nr:aldehyde dehydrogenase family protein [Balneolales bacterium]